MKIPKELLPLVDDGVIDAVMSGKEAAVYVVRTGDDVMCAKVYKDLERRSFQQRVQYQEGRKVRGSRQARAMGKATEFGRREQEAAWKSTGADALYQLSDAGVRVPRPHGFFHGVLLMGLVTDEDGHSAPRLGEEMWSLYERGKLTADHALTGEFTFDERTADTRAELTSIEDARQVALIREQGRQAAADDD